MSQKLTIDAASLQAQAAEERVDDQKQGVRFFDEDEDEDFGSTSYVQIRQTNTHEAICRVTCPDKTGLGADLARGIFDFGLVIVKGDFATDGSWAFVLLTIYAPPASHELSKTALKKKKKKTKKKKNDSNKKITKKKKKKKSSSKARDGRNNDNSDDDETNNGSNFSNSSDDDDDDDDDDESSDDDDDQYQSKNDTVEKSIPKTPDDTNGRETGAVNWKLLQKRLESICPRKSSITTGNNDSSSSMRDSSSMHSKMDERGMGGKRGHSRRSSSRLDEIINMNNKNGNGKTHAGDLNDGSSNNNNQDSGDVNNVGGKTNKDININNSNNNNGRRTSHNDEDRGGNNGRGGGGSKSNNNNNSQQQQQNNRTSYSDFDHLYDDRDGFDEYKPSTFILRVELDDRVGLLRDLTLTLWECNLTVHRAHISTSPANTAVDLFYVTDMMDELPNEDRIKEIEKAVISVVSRGHAVKIGLHQVPNNAMENMIRARWLDDFSSRVESASATEYASCDVWVDNLMSDRHTVFQMISRDRKGLLYDVLRASKELKVQIYYAKVEMKSGGLCEIDLFCERMTNDENARYLCQKYKQNIERPVAVQITSKGIDDLSTELRVICPLDITGVTRPRVLLDATDALRRINIMVFKADIVIDPGFSQDEYHLDSEREDFMIHRLDSSDEIVQQSLGGDKNSSSNAAGAGGSPKESDIQHSLLNNLRSPSRIAANGVHRTSAREVHRFLLTDEHGLPITNVRDRKVICDAVLKSLLGLRGTNEYFPGMSEMSESDLEYSSGDEKDASDGRQNNRNNTNSRKNEGVIKTALRFAKRLVFRNSE